MHCLINCLAQLFCIVKLSCSFCREVVSLLRSQQTVMVFKAGCSGHGVAVRFKSASRFKAWNFTANGLCSWPKPAQLSCSWNSLCTSVQYKGAIT